MDIKIPDNITEIIEKLEENGFEAYIVGGCVRDILMDITPHDYDVTTNALPNQVKSIFEKTVDTGLKHGTVTVISDNIPVEVTTYRTESGYTDNRRPDKVDFVLSLSEDLSRRDFTVNAIGYNEKRGFVDLFGGIKDIKNAVLKAVGEPETRFKEDALRILRLFRFASTLNFSIESNTYNAAISCLPLIQNVSSERIAKEIEKASLGGNISVLEPIINNGGLKFLNIGSCKKLEKISNLSRDNNLRLFALLSLCDCNPEDVAKRLKLSNSTKEFFRTLNSFLSNEPPKTKSNIKKLLNCCDFDTFISYTEYLSVINNTSTEDITKMFNEIIENNEPYKISQLDINGIDIMNCGYTDKAVGEILNYLLDKIIDNPRLNEKEKLLSILKNYRN